MRRLFDGIWRVITTLYRLIVIGMLLVFGLLAYAAFKGGTPVRVPDGVALVLAPTGQIVDQRDADPTQRLFEDLAGDVPSQTALRELTDALHAAANDDRIHAVVLKLDELWGLGQAQARELASALQRVRQAGKPVHAHEAFYTQTQFLLAAQADSVSLDPLGGVWIEGFSSYNNYFREGLDKLGITVNVFRVGQYKSAVEPFMRSGMSDEARLASSEWLGDLWRAYQSDVEIARSATPRTVAGYVADLASENGSFDGNAAQLARRHGLVTHVETREQFRQRLGADLGIDSAHGSFHQIHHAQYLTAARREGRVPGHGQSDHVGLVVVQGNIVDGYADEGMADASLIAQQLDQARRDNDIKAVVLRVNSPGGSVYGSERIRRAVQRLRGTGKPVVASMGNLAASGGYWAAMDADHIYAHESTITGSIGIFGLVPTFEQGLGKLGIRTDGVGTTELAGSFRTDRELGDAARRVIQREIEYGYREFISGVSAARGLASERVEAIAQGRVWSGIDALDLGLVDGLGGLDDALDAAAELARIDGYSVHEYRPESGFPFGLLSPFGGGVQLPWVPQWIGELLRGHGADRAFVARFAWLREPRGAYAHCLCETGWR